MYTGLTNDFSDHKDKAHYRGYDELVAGLVPTVPVLFDLVAVVLIDEFFGQVSHNFFPIIFWAF